jgi:hypothetical protein
MRGACIRSVFAGKKGRSSSSAQALFDWVQGFAQVAQAFFASSKEFTLAMTWKASAM